MTKLKLRMRVDLTQNHWPETGIETTRHSVPFQPPQSRQQPQPRANQRPQISSRRSKSRRQHRTRQQACQRNTVSCQRACQQRLLINADDHLIASLGVYGIHHLKCILALSDPLAEQRSATAARLATQSARAATHHLEGRGLPLNTDDQRLFFNHDLLSETDGIADLAYDHFGHFTHDNDLTTVHHLGVEIARPLQQMTALGHAALVQHLDKQ